MSCECIWNVCSSLLDKKFRSMCQPQKFPHPSPNRYVTILKQRHVQVHRECVANHLVCFHTPHLTCDSCWGGPFSCCGKYTPWGLCVIHHQFHGWIFSTCVGCFMYVQHECGWQSMNWHTEIDVHNVWQWASFLFLALHLLLSPSFASPPPLSSLFSLLQLLGRSIDLNALLGQRLQSNMLKAINLAISKFEASDLCSIVVSPLSLCIIYSGTSI